MSIAVIGWGSLVWDPRNLAIAPDWHDDGPLLPVEFTRVSKGDRLTLVIDDHAVPQQTQWARSRMESIDDAVRDLMKREGVESIKAIGVWSLGDAAPNQTQRGYKVIAEWAQAKGLRGAAWTALGPKAPDGSHRRALDDDLVEYLRRLDAGGRAAEARTYFERAPRQIQTALRKRVRQELGWA